MGSEFLPLIVTLLLRKHFRYCCQSTAIDLQQYDHPHSLLLLWQGNVFRRMLYIVALTLSLQVVADLWERYLALLDEGKEDGYVLDKGLEDGEDSYKMLSEAMDILGLKRYCCRRMLMTHVDLIEKLLRYANF